MNVSHPAHFLCGLPFCNSIHNPFVEYIQQKRQLCQSRRASKVLAYYGLTTPPYKLDALEPYMSQRTLELHWGKHHRDYVDSLNKQLVNSPLYGHTMEELIKVTYNNGNPLPEFNNAAQVVLASGSSNVVENDDVFSHFYNLIVSIQSPLTFFVEVWNHDFFWESMQPGGGKLPQGGVLQQIEKDFDSYSKFRDKFVDSAMALFGSGWVWLVLRTEEKKLSVVRTSNAICPLIWDDIPIIGLDMWEHAYYLDYKDDREKYINTFMDNLVSWHAATVRMLRAEAFVNLGEPKIPVA